MIFCFLWDFSSSHSAHGQSPKTKIHESPNIKLENTKSHGSTHSGINGEWAISGATRPITDKTIGNTQQNKCGKIDAINPNLIALFFIILPFIYSRFAHDNENDPLCFPSAFAVLKKRCMFQEFIGLRRDIRLHCVSPRQV